MCYHLEPNTPQISVTDRYLQSLGLFDHWAKWDLFEIMNFDCLYDSV